MITKVARVGILLDDKEGFMAGEGPLILEALSIKPRVIAVLP
tara:strand:- start:494 stop:619 length:126 start_codon:yes stop_codon:yes gene_type:complete